MKKLFAILLSTALLLCACGKKTDDKKTATDTDTDTSIEMPSTDSVVDNGEIDTQTATEPDILPANASLLDEIEKLSREKIGYGCGIDVDENNRSVGAQMMQSDYGEYDAYFISEPDNCIYLTFDEGYENGYTSQILDVLKQKGVTATFFVTLDYAEKNGDLIKRMIDGGHTVGNHTVNHPSMPTLSVSEMQDEINGLGSYIKEKFGYEMSTFRPPMGEFSEQSLAVTKSLGYKSVFWSFAYKDWLTDDQPNPDEAYERVIKATHDGAIYLLHAVSSTNTSILGAVIDYWKSMGYTVKAFS